jgi:hypothetical protein
LGNRHCLCKLVRVLKALIFVTAAHLHLCSCDVNCYCL